MKTKIFLILIIIIFAVSCTKNNPANPVNVSGNNSSDTETKDTSSSDDSKNNNTGTAKHTINTKGIITQPEDIEIYADIYMKMKILLNCIYQVEYSLKMQEK